MPLPTKNTAPPRELAPAGTHSAICIGHYHIGTQESPQYGDKEQIILSFAIDEMREDGKPHILSTNALTLSFDDRANLAGYLKSWIGRTIPQGEEFDTASLVDRPCLLTVSHGVSKKGNTFAAIDTISSLPKGMAPFRCELSTFDYSPIDPSKPIPTEVPQWIAEKIQQSIEWKSYHQGGSGAPRAVTNGHKSTQTNGDQPNYNPPPEKPPMVVKPYLAAIGLKWPYKPRELDAALAEAAKNPNNTAEDIAEAEAVLRPHEDQIPF